MNGRDPFGAGAAAGHADVALSACPYNCTVDGGLAKRWAEGWAAAVVVRFEGLRAAQGTEAPPPFHVQQAWHLPWTWTERWALAVLAGAVPVKVAAAVLGRSARAVHNARLRHVDDVARGPHGGVAA